jgi:hypothetical protein
METDGRCVRESFRGVPRSSARHAHTSRMSDKKMSPRTVNASCMNDRPTLDEARLSTRFDTGREWNREGIAKMLSFLPMRIATALSSSLMSIGIVATTGPLLAMILSYVTMTLVATVVDEKLGNMMGVSSLQRSLELHLIDRIRDHAISRSARDILKRTLARVPGLVLPTESHPWTRRVWHSPSASVKRFFNALAVPVDAQYASATWRTALFARTYTQLVVDYGMTVLTMTEFVLGSDAATLADLVPLVTRTHDAVRKISDALEDARLSEDPLARLRTLAEGSKNDKPVRHVLEEVAGACEALQQAWDCTNDGVHQPYDGVCASIGRVKRRAPPAWRVLRVVLSCTSLRPRQVDDTSEVEQSDFMTQALYSYNLITAMRFVAHHDPSYLAIINRMLAVLRQGHLLDDSSSRVSATSVASKPSAASSLLETLLKHVASDVKFRALDHVTKRTALLTRSAPNTV